MNVCKIRGKDVNQVTSAEFIDYFDDRFARWHPYLQTIALWQSYFDDVFVGYFDRLLEDPIAYFRDICTFLGIDEDAVTKRLDKPVHRGIPGTLPLDLRHYLYTQYAEEIHTLADSGIVYAHKWLDEHNAIVNSGSTVS